MVLLNKYVIGTHVMFYEIELYKEFIDGLINMLDDVENKDNVTIDLCFNMSEKIEKIDYDKISKGELISVFNHGKMERDFTYIDDIISGTRSAIDKNYPCEVFNLGNNNSEDLMEMVGLIESEIGKKAEIQFEGMQPGDVKRTFADIEHSKQKLNYMPTTKIVEGIPKFIEWYLTYN